MKNMSTDKQRIEALLTHLKKSANDLAKSIGYKRTDKIYHIINERNGISPAVAKDITTTFVDIDYNWLLTGEGEMLKKSPSEELSTAKAEINADSAKEWSEFVRSLAEGKLNMMNGNIQWNDEWTIPQEYGEKIAMLYIESRKETEYWRNKAQDLEYKLAKLEMS